MEQSGMMNQGEHFYSPDNAGVYADFSRAGLEARATANWESMIAAGGSLERIGAYREAWSLLADAAIIRLNPHLTEWMGFSMYTFS